MTRRPAKVQAMRKLYELLRLAAARRQPMEATYDGPTRLLLFPCVEPEIRPAPVFFYQFGGSGNSGLPMAPEGVAAGVVSPWRNSAKSSCARMHGTPSRV
jgi:hypothetical protein